MVKRESPLPEQYRSAPTLPMPVKSGALLEERQPSELKPAYKPANRKVKEHLPGFTAVFVL